LSEIHMSVPVYVYLITLSKGTLSLSTFS
jgi:hypothetical protein